MVVGSSPISTPNYHMGTVAQLVEHVKLLTSIFPDKYGVCSSEAEWLLVKEMVGISKFLMHPKVVFRGSQDVNS